MKIALLFTGQIRGDPQLAIRQKDFFIDMGYDVDIYIHTWFDGIGLQLADTRCNSTMTDPTKTIQSLAPIAFRIDPQERFTNRGLPYASEIGGITAEQRERGLFVEQSQYLSMRRAFELIPEPTIYDYIVRTRFDLQCLDDDVKDMFTGIQDRQLMVIDCKWQFGWPLGNLVFAGTPATMTKFCMSAYDTYVRLVTCLNKILHIHTFVELCAKELDLQIVPVYIRFLIVRVGQIGDHTTPPYWQSYIDQDRFLIKPE